MAEESQHVLDSVDIMELMELLPHRYPFLLVDKIVDINGDDSAVGIKNVTVNEPHFQGHFPTRPIMPGVLIVEAMAQTAGAICARKQGAGGNLVYFMTIDNARFRKRLFLATALKSGFRSRNSVVTSGSSTAMLWLTMCSSPKQISAP